MTNQIDEKLIGGIKVIVDEKVFDGSIKNKLEKEVISFTVSTGKDGKVFGSISSKQIYEELNKRGYKVDKKQIVITDSLSSIGMFYVDVVLHKKVICKLRVELKSK